MCRTLTKDPNCWTIYAPRTKQIPMKKIRQYSEHRSVAQVLYFIFFFFAVKNIDLSHISPK